MVYLMSKNIYRILKSSTTEGEGVFGDSLPISFLVPLPDPKRKDFTYLAEVTLNKSGVSVHVNGKVPNLVARERFINQTAIYFSRLFRTLKNESSED